MTFIATGMLYYGLLLFKLRKILKIKDQKMASSVENEVQTSNSVIKLDRLMLVFYVLMFNWQTLLGQPRSRHTAGTKTSEGILNSSKDRKESVTFTWEIKHSLNHT